MEIQGKKYHKYFLESSNEPRFVGSYLELRYLVFFHLNVGW